MQLIETETGARKLAGERSLGSSSPARRGVGEVPVASRSLAARLRQNVWMPLLAKTLGVLAGMLALAAIGASSLAKGPGVPPASSAQRSAGMAAGAAPFAAPSAAPRLTESKSPHAGATPEADAADGGSTPSDGGAPSAALTPDGKVILNLASVSELRLLPGVGPKRAEAILALRAKLGGRFKRITDLLRVKGIGTKGLKKIEASAVLDAPKS